MLSFLTISLDLCIRIASDIQQIYICIKFIYILDLIYLFLDRYFRYTTYFNHSCTQFRFYLYVFRIGI